MAPAVDRSGLPALDVVLDVQLSGTQLALRSCNGATWASAGRGLRSLICGAAKIWAQCESCTSLLRLMPASFISFLQSKRFLTPGAVDGMLAPFLREHAGKRPPRKMSSPWSSGNTGQNKTHAQLASGKGIHHDWTVAPDYAHWWTLWRVYLRDVLPRLFEQN